jgi:predicted DCC family thiol-disulfide oxidoreductase YuxK
MIYDGECRFCTLWIRRWQCITGDRVDYLPAQDARVGREFPEIPASEFERSVQLISPAGVVYSGAEAVFRSLATHPRWRFALNAYELRPGVAAISETCYAWIARHRRFASVMTRLLWGSTVEPPTHIFVRWAFLRCLGIIYLIAFASLWVQLPGLFGTDGIRPSAAVMASVRQQVSDSGIGMDRYHLVPTLCWFDAGDRFLKAQCVAGMVLALLVIGGMAPSPCLFLLWLIYLSLCTVGEPFLNFQWDALLLEAGLLAIFIAPWQWLPRRPARERPVSRIGLWLLRWLVFRLMFESGCVKLASGDAAWRHLTALTFHYETQPLPTWIGWHAHQLPLWVQKSDTAMMFAIELFLPFLIFFPRRPRQLAFLGFVALQLFILLTGNYGFFNLLTMVLCLTLLDDAALHRCVPRRWRTCPAPEQVTDKAARWPLLLRVPLAIVVVFVSLIQLPGLFRVSLPWPRTAVAAYQWLAPFRSFNSYGLFAVMTTSRPEIIIEGSNDLTTWQPYEFKYKPGDLKRAPQFVEPHMPRLDWQLWFTALGDRNPWFEGFCFRLLQGSPDVLALLARNPFPNAPPKYIRAVLYEYHFTDRATRARTGEWWRREEKGILFPPVSLPETQASPAPEH